MADSFLPPAAISTVASTAQPVSPPPPPPALGLATDAAVSTPGNATHQTAMPEAGSSLALFSTELGTRPPRNVAGPPFPPVIVRSDKITGVVDAARFWQKKFRWQCLSIFPDCGWTIEDLWDEQDIHMDGAEHCREVLKFISQESFWNAKHYALDWSRKYPDRTFGLVGAASLRDIYDPADPLAIVDKIFVLGESNDVPRAFLWHVAQIMRTTMLDVRKAQNQAKANTNPMASPSTPAEGHSAEKAPDTSEGTKTPLAVDASPAQSGASGKKTKSKTNRKQSRSRPLKLSEPAVSASASAAQAPAVGSVQGPAPIAAYYAQPPPASFGVAVGDSAPIVPPDFQHPTAHYHNFIPSPYQQNTASGSWIENRSRGPSMNYSEVSSSSIPLPGAHSPHNYPFALDMGQPQVGSFNPMQPPFVQGPHVSPLPTSAAQPYNPNVIPPNRFTPQPTYIVGPPIPGGYTQQHLDNRGTRGMSMGDMTNNSYYARGTSAQNASQYRPNNRRNSLYDQGSLYDPYNGTNPAFNEHNNGRKVGRSGYIDHSDRPRKASVPELGSASPAQVTSRLNNYHTNSVRYASYGQARPLRESDPAITGNEISGCDHTWIGPENETVNELFVSDLPDDTESHELHHMFLQHANTKPVHVDIKHTSFNKYAHAFVTFNSSSDAKAVLSICNKTSPRLRGAVVHVTVPRRFFQKQPDRPPSDSGRSELDQKDEHGIRTVRVKPPKEKNKAANEGLPTQTLYSSQDAGSDLQKDQPQKSARKDPPSKDSPKARKGKQINSAPTQQVDVQKEPSKENTSDQDDQTPSSIDTTQRLITGGVGQNDNPRKIEGDEQTSITLEVSKIVTIEPKPIDDESVPSAEETSSTCAPDTKDEEGMMSSEDLAQIQDPHVEPQAETKHDEKSFTESADRVSSNSFRTASDDELQKKHPNKSGTSTDTQQKAHLGDTNPGTVLTSVAATIGCDEPPVASPAESLLTNHDFLPPAPDSTKARPSTEVSVPVADSDHSSRPGTPTLEVANSITTKQEKMTASNPVMLQTAPAPASTETVKKSGPQQTTSLNPFAKTKAQRQKEKELKKREKHKKLEEKASKLKGDKSESSSSKDQQLQVPNNSNDNNPSKGKATATASGTTGQAGTVKESKVKIKDRGKGPSSEIPGIDKTIDNDGSVSGKQLGGVTTTLSNKTGSVTYKAAMTATENQTGPDLTLAPSPRPDGEQAAEAVASSPSPKKPLVKGDTTPTPAKGKKPVPVIPNLSINPNAHLPVKNVHQLRHVSPTAASNFSVSPAANTDSVQHTLETDALSVSSSNTTLNNDAAMNRLSSPNSEVFFTPMQTPAMQQNLDTDATDAPSTAQDDAPKPKKKKPKKKKKKSVAPATNAESPTPVGNVEPPATAGGTAHISTRSNNSFWSDDPFGEQMSHIDAIRKSVNDPDTYYFQVNKELADENLAKDGEKAIKAAEARLESAQNELREQTSKELYDHLDSFFKENWVGPDTGSSFKAVTKDDLH